MTMVSLINHITKLKLSASTSLFLSYAAMTCKKEKQVSK